MTQSAPTLETYAQALDYLFSHTDYERMARVRYHGESWDLSRMRRLCELLDQPQDAFPSIHLAGTKGKGSTAAMVATMLAASGHKVGLYTSPHLVDLRERIVVLSAETGEGGPVVKRQMISEDAFTQCMRRVVPAIERMAVEGGAGGGVPSFFEIVTAVAFLHFAADGEDSAVLEVGLGGRLDATNVVTPRVCAISPIGIDHQLQLGNTLGEIAAEKAGIIKPGVPVVSAPQHPEAEAVVRRIAREKLAPLRVVGTDLRVSVHQDDRRPPRRWHVQVTGPTRKWDPVAVPLLGRHQAVNTALALGVIGQLQEAGWQIDADAARTGLAQTCWPGRIDLRGRRPWVVLDGAHTIESMRAVIRTLPETFDYDRLITVFSCLSDKDQRGLIGQVVGASRFVVLTRSDHPHAADPQDLARLLGMMGPTVAGRIVPDAADAMDAAMAEARPGDLVLVVGSIYLVGLMEKLNRERGWFHRGE